MHCALDGDGQGSQMLIRRVVALLSFFSLLPAANAAWLASTISAGAGLVISAPASRMTIVSPVLSYFNVLDRVCNDYAIGCEKFFTESVQQVTIDFTRVTSLNFDRFLGRLLDDREEALALGLFLLDPLTGDGGGGVNTCLESRCFVAGSNDLKDPSEVVAVDVIRLVIEYLNFEQSGRVVNVNWLGHWEFYGQPGPDWVPQRKVGEPGSLLLVGLGLLALIARRQVSEAGRCDSLHCPVPSLAARGPNEPHQFEASR